MAPPLLRRKDGQGRVLAVEVMVNNEAVANLIRKGKTFQIPSVIVAMKFIAAGLVDEETVGRFKQEVSLSRQFSHPKVIRLYGPDSKLPRARRAAQLFGHARRLGAAKR